ncbi:hypothetical protein PG994_007713 [Apiospora phragmitis]|uniref:Sexual differentiation process protein isp4 n=1 Tax=Apiospora phragmitis TaxID=2905665 RepID=A0ABR1UR20_9PEZI
MSLLQRLRSRLLPLQCDLVSPVLGIVNWAFLFSQIHSLPRYIGTAKMSFFNLRKRNDHTEVTPQTDSDDAGATGVEALSHLQTFEKLHKLDPNLPLEELNDVGAVLATGNLEKGVEVEATLLEENSPYPEVRAAVRNYDEDMPANTVRAWVIGMLLCTVGSAVNMLFSLRNPGVSVTTYVIQLVAYPLGLGWDLIFPDRVFNVFGLKFNLKPGKFNYKEHVVITVMSNAAYGGGFLYATDVLITQEFWYKQHFGWGFQLLLGITTLCTGFGLAGLARRFLVWPAAMIWPSTLVNAQLFYTLHDRPQVDTAKANGWKMGKYKYFLIVFGASFVWYWFPGWIFQGLSYFTFVCWAKPDNVVVNKLFGGLHGYGLIPLTFDWTVISGYALSPLIPPWHAIANTLAGVFVMYEVVSIGLHFSNVWYGQYFVPQSSSSFDNTGAKYNVTRVLDENLQFVEKAYHDYSPLFLSTQFALCYGLSFAAVSAVIVHTALYHGKEIWAQLKQARHQEDDVHLRLMKKYRDAEDWWYLAVFVVMIGLSFGVVCGWPTGFPAWAYVICMIIPIIWTVPIGIVQAISNIQIGLNVLTEFIIGYMLPGRPLAMMMFKNYGNIEGICTEDQKDSYTCPQAGVFYTASVVWGAIGPARMFSPGALYANLQWFWLVGAVTPVITWFFARRYPKSFWRYVSMPLFFGGSGMIPPATDYNYISWGIVGLTFNYWIRKKWNGWWLHYNYVTSAALDCGLIVATVIIFLTLQLTNATPPQWFGNLDVFTNLDQSGTAISMHVADGETFGPATWK